jgi:hypothetical protein
MYGSEEYDSMQEYVDSLQEALAGVLPRLMIESGISQ